jgi:tape measure domain-containing protein
MDWTARLNDALSGPAGRMEKSLHGFEESLKGARAAMDELRPQTLGAKMNSLRSALKGIKAPALEQGGGGWLDSLMAARGAMGGQVAMLTAIAGAAIAAAMAVGRLGAAFMKTVVDAADFRAGTVAAIDTLTKKVGEGERSFDIAMKLSARFSMDPRQAAESIHALISKGFSADQANVILTAMADLKVLSPKANLDKVSLAIEQIKGKGKLQMEELQGQLAEAGVSVDLVLQELAKKYKKSTDDIRKMISAGKIDADEGVFAIVSAIKRMGTGKLGEAAEKAARNSIGGLVEGIRASATRLTFEIAKVLNESQAGAAGGLTGGPGMVALKGALGNVLDVINPDKSPAAKKLISEAAGFANDFLTGLFGPLSGAGGASALQTLLGHVAATIAFLRGAMNAVLPLLTSFGQGLGEGFSEFYQAARSVMSIFGQLMGGGDWLKSLAPLARMAGRGLAFLVGILVVLVAVLGATVGAVASFFAAATSVALAVVGAISTVIMGLTNTVLGGIDSIVTTVTTALNNLYTDGLNAGQSLWQGLVAGILAGVTAVLDAGSQLANTAKTAVTSTLAINSPSRVMADLGGHTAAGFAQGVDDGATSVDASMNAMVAPPAPGATAVGAAAGAGGGSASVTVGDIHIHLPAGSAGDPQAIGASVREQIAQYLEDALAQAGLSPVPA